MKNLSHYETLAELFVFPGEGFHKKVRNIADLVKKNYPEAEADMEKFMTLLPGDLERVSELFTRSFDVQAVTTLDVGYVLFGDDYKRGELLSNLNREHNNAGVDCRGELADNLANILRLMARLEDENLIQEIVEDLLIPSLKRMISEFQPERLEQLNKVYKKHYKTLIESSPEGFTMYLSTLRVIDTILRIDFRVSNKPEKRPTSDFLQSIDNEFKTEAKAVS